MTRTYRMTVDTGISDRMMDYLRNELPTETGFGDGRYKATDFYRGPGIAYFDYELILLLNGSELFSVSDPEDPVEVENYYSNYSFEIMYKILFNQLKFDLIFDSGDP